MKRKVIINSTVTGFLITGRVIPAIKEVRDLNRDTIDLRESRDIVFYLIERERYQTDKMICNRKLEYNYSYVAKEFAL